jgi:hypothetical protein
MEDVKTEDDKALVEMKRIELASASKEHVDDKFTTLQTSINGMKTSFDLLLPKMQEAMGQSMVNKSEIANLKEGQKRHEEDIRQLERSGG